MNIMENAEKECAVLGVLFQGIINDMKVRLFFYFKQIFSHTVYFVSDVVFRTVHRCGKI